LGDAEVLISTSELGFPRYQNAISLRALRSKPMCAQVRVSTLYILNIGIEPTLISTCCCGGPIGDERMQYAETDDSPRGIGQWTKTKQEAVIRPIIATHPRADLSWRARIDCRSPDAKQGTDIVRMHGAPPAITGCRLGR